MSGWVEAEPPADPAAARDAVLRGYADTAGDLIEPYEAISSERLFGPIGNFLPTRIGRAVDLGAGTGRDAAWLAERGWSVLAVEPVEGFRAAGRARHRVSRIEWLGDSLPDLAHTLARREIFDVIILNGVWHHLVADQRRVALANVFRLAGPGGRILMSLRHGPGPTERPCYPLDVAETVALAHASGFDVLHRESRESIQTANRAAGVTWTWLVLSA